MPITVNFPDNFFTSDEKGKLMNIFSISNDDDFLHMIQNLSLAAIDEYRDMLLGMGVPSRANEIKEYRLFHLIKYFYKKRIPEEMEISILFQLSESRSRTLLQNVLARFRFFLTEPLDATLKQIIDSAQEREDHIYEVLIKSPSFVDELNRRLITENPRFPKVTKVRGETNTYSIKPDPYDFLSKHFAVKE